ncbi:hypothetical protein BVI434_180058 [Burkholderia vietnamiensis]|nr:hypothetical protein BVI434_180058 [Burkholderia vietnamiensis]
MGSILLRALPDGSQASGVTCYERIHFTSLRKKPPWHPRHLLFRRRLRYWPTPSSGWVVPRSLACSARCA